jgi:hypothetical protein
VLLNDFRCLGLGQYFALRPYARGTGTSCLRHYGEAHQNSASIDDILSAIQGKTDRKIYSKNEPATSWREPRLLKAIAEQYCRFTMVPAMVKAWSEAGTTPKGPAETSKASSGASGPDGVTCGMHGEAPSR